MSIRAMHSLVRQIGIEIKFIDTIEYWNDEMILEKINNLVFSSWFSVYLQNTIIHQKGILVLIKLTRISSVDSKRVGFGYFLSDICHGYIPSVYYLSFDKLKSRRKCSWIYWNSKYNRTSMTLHNSTYQIIHFFNTIFWYLLFIYFFFVWKILILN